jgi:hypothetical protein
MFKSPSPTYRLRISFRPSGDHVFMCILCSHNAAYNHFRGTLLGNTPDGKKTNECTLKFGFRRLIESLGVFEILMVLFK